ncbi:MAG TPA: heme ABC transporter substrate-binding protein IsdE [Eggerthellaceae bacterium]|nr:heme ABC transporter substrate-binding protein IsdE [Eggerthellaceae bacterium]
MLALYGLALSGCGAAQATVAPTASDSPRSGETAVSRATGQQAHETTAAQASSASTVQAGGASAIAGEVSQLLEITDPQERAAVQIAAEKVRYLGRTPNIVATSPAVVDVCDRLELDLVGVGHSSLFETPERYAGATEVGPPMSPDMEIVGSLAPDWILSPGSLQADLQPKYEAVGCDYAFLNLKSVQGMYRSIQELGEIFDRRDQASALVAEFTDFYRSYQAKNVAKTRPRVLVLMGMPGSYVIATPNSYVGNLVELAGGENVYAGAAEDFLSVNTEDMQTKDPDIILRCSHALPDQVKQMFAEEFQTNDIWKHFRAVQDGRVHDLPYDLFGMSATFDYPQALELLQGLLYDE